MKSEPRLVQQREAFLEHLSAVQQRSSNTLRAYAADLAGFVEYCDQQNVVEAAEADPKFLRKYLRKLQAGRCARSTVARKIASLRAFMKFLVDEGDVLENPAELLRNPKGEKKLPLFLEVHEAQKLMNAPDAVSRIGKRDRSILEVLYGSGIRVGELVALSLPDVDIDDGVLRVLGKGSKERLVYVGRAALHAVREWLMVRHHGYVEDAKAVFLNKQGHRLSDRSVRRMLDKYVRAVGLDPRVSPHTLRHTFATHLLNRVARIRQFIVSRW